jgi:membrane protein implicated in regulation of membrane protease activity
MLDSKLLIAIFAGLAAMAVIAYLARWLIDGLNYLIARFRRQGPAFLGERGLEGRAATVREPFVIDETGEEAHGAIFLHGERWSACCPADLARTLSVGDPVEIQRMEGLTARIRRKLP